MKLIELTGRIHVQASISECGSNVVSQDQSMLPWADLSQNKSVELVPKACVAQKPWAESSGVAKRQVARTQPVTKANPVHYSLALLSFKKII